MVTLYLVCEDQWSYSRTFADRQDIQPFMDSLLRRLEERMAMRGDMRSWFFYLRDKGTTLRTYVTDVTAYVVVEGRLQTIDNTDEIV